MEAPRLHLDLQGFSEKGGKDASILAFSPVRLSEAKEDKEGEEDNGNACQSPRHQLLHGSDDLHGIRRPAPGLYRSGSDHRYPLSFAGDAHIQSKRPDGREVLEPSTCSKPEILLKIRRCGLKGAPSVQED